VDLQTKHFNFALLTSKPPYGKVVETFDALRQDGMKEIWDVPDILQSRQHNKTFDQKEGGKGYNKASAHVVFSWIGSI